MNKTYYQILYKGVATNRIYLLNVSDYSRYRRLIDEIKADELNVLLTTNICEIPIDSD